MTPQYAPVGTPRVVLDTNVVLDWLLFGNPSGAALGQAIASGALHWIATAAMKDELAHVIARGAFDHRQPDWAALWAAWDRHCRDVPAPTTALTVPRCIDGDDQKFIDLAAGHPGALLLSRDRAVLKLARRLLPFGVRVATPAAWLATRG